MKTITVLSGKGGTGKSSFVASLSFVLSKKYKVVAVDCDVDTPNLSWLFGIKKLENKEIVSTNYKAIISKNFKCENINKLRNICVFSAIDVVEGKININKFLCEGCGACKLICPRVRLEKVRNGYVGDAKTKYNFYVVSGQLKIGESGSGNIVEIVKERAKKIAEREKADFMIIDSSAGIGCPVIASVKESDFVIAITEPTISSFHDMKRALQVVEHFKIPYGIVINKYELNESFSRKIENFAKKYKIPMIGKIPYDKKFIDALVNLKPVVVYDKNYEKIFYDIWNKLKIYLLYNERDLSLVDSC